MCWTSSLLGNISWSGHKTFLASPWIDDTALGQWANSWDWKKKDFRSNGSRYGSRLRSPILAIFFALAYLFSPHSSSISGNDVQAGRKCIFHNTLTEYLCLIISRINEIIAPSDPYCLSHCLICWMIILRLLSLHSKARVSSTCLLGATQSTQEA